MCMQKRSKQRLKKKSVFYRSKYSIVLASVLLWVIACALPAYIATEDPQTSISGINAFLLGFFLVIAPFELIFWGWISNFLWLSLVIMTLRRSKNIRAKGYLGMAILLFVGMAALPGELMFDNENDIRPANIALGGIVWMIALIVLAIPAVIQLWRKLYSRP